MSRWFVTGASGLLGHVLCAYLGQHGHSVTAIRRQHPLELRGVTDLVLDVTDFDAVRKHVRAVAPDVIVHAAGLTSVDACEKDEPYAHLIHGEAAAVLAEEGRRMGARMVNVSTDHLWDGSTPMVREDEPPRPMNAYARTKLAGERAALTANPDTLVLRVNFFGPDLPWRQSLSGWVLTNLRGRTPINAFEDVYFTPISTLLLVPLIVSMVERGAKGIFHLCGSERVSKYAFAVRLAEAAGLDRELVRPAPVATAGLVAPRPHDMSLSTAKAATFLGHPLPDLEQSIGSLFTAGFSQAAHERFGVR